MSSANSIVAIYSGGLDSTVMLYQLASEGRLREAVSFDYGQKHSKELAFARQNCEALGIPHFVCDMRSMVKIFGDNSLTCAGAEVPEGNYADENMKSTVVPNRNMIMVSAAAARAISIGCDGVAYAAHSGDHAIYPDCRSEFTDALEKVLALCHYTPIALLRPFVNCTKAEIVGIGAKLGVDFSKTWSCYKGGDLHCGKCGTCMERRQAFELAGVKDPTQYSA